MNYFDSDQWEEIFDTLRKNRTRTFLTAFGIFWGVFMLILLMGGGRGLETMLGENFAGAASNSGFMVAGVTSEPYKGFRSGRQWHLELDDVERIRNGVPEISVVSPIILKHGSSAVSNDNSCRVTIFGYYANMQQVDNPKIIYGRAISDADGRQLRKVCVIGKRVAEVIFPDVKDPCGRFLQLDSINYCVVGVSNKTNGVNIGGNPQTSIMLPYETMRHMYNRGNTVDIIALVAKGQYRMSAVQYKVEALLKHVHMLHPDDSQALLKINTEAIFAMIDNLFSGVNILVWMIGLGTLLAGAIGVSNIMVVTVKERTTEIGIRRAIGATPRNILFMVMSESIVLTLLAGMSGITLAVFILQTMENSLSKEFPSAMFQISFGIAIGAASLLTLLGVLAGLAPAIRAMKTKPVDAMREE